MARGRKPRNWVRLDCQGILHGSINYIYSLDEQAVFIKMIAMAEVYGPEPGLISDNDTRALPKEYVAHELHCSLDVLESVLTKGKKDKAIAENGAGIELLNYAMYQFTEYDRQKQYRQKPDDEDRKTYGEFQNVFLTDTQYQKLTERLGEQKVGALIESLSIGIQSKGYKYKDYYATLINWAKRDEKDGTHQRSTQKLRPRGSYTKSTNDNV